MPRSGKRRVPRKARAGSRRAHRTSGRARPGSAGSRASDAAVARVDGLRRGRTGFCRRRLAALVAGAATESTAADRSARHTGVEPDRRLPGRRGGGVFRAEPGSRAGVEAVRDHGLPGRTDDVFDILGRGRDAAVTRPTAVGGCDRGRPPGRFARADGTGNGDGARDRVSYNYLSLTRARTAVDDPSYCERHDLAASVAQAVAQRARAAREALDTAGHRAAAGGPRAVFGGADRRAAGVQPGPETALGPGLRLRDRKSVV